MLTKGHAPRWRNERGSVLMLMPAAFLILLVLGAIAVDLTAIRVGQRSLLSSATDAANDAVTVGLDEDSYRSGEGYRLDPERVRAAVYAVLYAKGILHRLSTAPTITIHPDSSVTVELRGKVDHIFGRALPGVSDPVPVRAGATARAITK
jgi:Flp pilus assembly protein TadG